MNVIRMFLLLHMVLLGTQTTNMPLESCHLCGMNECHSRLEAEMNLVYTAPWDRWTVLHRLAIPPVMAAE